MTTLMIYAGAVSEDAATNRTGGLPLLAADVEWPRCRECGGNMQFLARFEARFERERVIQVFMCDNDPGGCDTWAANGANAVIVSPPGPAPVRQPPAEGVTTLGSVAAFDLVHSDVDEYLAAHKAWRGKPVLGQLGGTPSWYQDDEVPDCPECGVPQQFVAQLEEGADHRTAANFGGCGCAYVFACAEHDLGTFLWQR